MNTLFSNLDQKSKIPRKKGFLFTDGGSRGNPGIAGCGAVLYDDKRKEIAVDKKFCGIQTNNFAEYQGLIIGLELALKNEITDLVVFMDSKLIVEQMSGNYKVKNVGLKPLFEQAKNICENFAGISFKHIPREKNKVADMLANQAMDTGK
jgi:ribonuclease HI